MENIENKPSPQPDSMNIIKQEKQIYLGNLLKELRLKHNLTKEQLAQHTKIFIDFIDALEAGQFEKVPNFTVTKGFVKNILKQYSVDPLEYLTILNQCVNSTSVDFSKKPDINKKILATQGSRSWGERLRIFPAIRFIKKNLSIYTMLTTLLFLLGMGVFLERGLIFKEQRNIPPKNIQSEVTKKEKKPLEKKPVEIKTNLEMSKKADALILTPLLLGNFANFDFFQKPDDLEQLLFTKSINNNKSYVEKSENQTVKVVVKEPVKISVKIDLAPETTELFVPNTYFFIFQKKAQFIIYNAGAVDIVFNNKPIGTLGKKDQIRRIAFISKIATLNDKM